MIRFTGMFKWVILFIHCCCLAPNITRRIKAGDTQQEVSRGKKGNVVFYLHPASISELISGDIILAVAYSAVDLTPSTTYFTSVISMDSCGCGCVKTIKTGNLYATVNKSVFYVHVEAENVKFTPKCFNYLSVFGAAKPESLWVK